MLNRYLYMDQKCRERLKQLLITYKYSLTGALQFSPSHIVHKECEMFSDSRNLEGKIARRVVWDLISFKFYLLFLILLYKTTLYSFHIISRCFSKCQNVFCPKKHNYAWKAIASDSDKTYGIIPIMFSLSILKNLVRYLNKQTNRQVYIMHLWT